MNPLLSDPVTGMLNRMGLISAIAGESGKWRALFLDLVGFGNFSKYSEGDRELARAAQAVYKDLTAQFPSRTLIFSRWGGDEFLILMSPTLSGDFGIPAEGDELEIVAGEREADGVEYRFATREILLDDAYPKSLIEVPQKAANGETPLFQVQVNASDVYAFLVAVVDDLYNRILSLKRAKAGELG
jgi:GGDEF domain-containing protein